ncbi:hypothetical protein D3C71_1833240 [compost metagenome]
MSTNSSGVTCNGATPSAGMIDSKARLRPSTESTKVRLWLRFQAMASITTMIVALMTNSGSRAMKC